MSLAVDILKDPEFAQLPGERQAAIRQEVLGAVVIDPDFQALQTQEPERAMDFLMEVNGQTSVDGKPAPWHPGRLLDVVGEGIAEVGGAALNLLTAPGELTRGAIASVKTVQPVKRMGTGEFADVMSEGGIEKVLAERGPLAATIRDFASGFVDPLVFVPLLTRFGQGVVRGLKGAETVLQSVTVAPGKAIAALPDEQAGAVAAAVPEERVAPLAAALPDEQVTPQAAKAVDPITKPRSELPPAQSENLAARADVASDFVVAGAPGGRVFQDNLTGPGMEVSGYGSTYPDWYGPLKMKKKDVLTALDKIKRDRGADVGVGVEKVKQAILEDADLDKLVGEFPEVQLAVTELRAVTKAAGVPPAPPPAVPAIAGASGELDDLTRAYLKLEVQKDVNTKAVEAFKAGAIQFDASKRINVQVREAIKAGKLDVTAYTDKLGMTVEQFADELYGKTVSFGGKSLQSLSWVKQALQEHPELAEQIKQAAQAAEENAFQASVWRRLDNIRRGLLVTQMSTAARNFETQVGRVGLDVLETAMDAGLARATGVPYKGGALDGWERAMQIFTRGTKEQVNAVLHAFPDEQARLVSTYSSDIASQAEKAGAALSAGDKALAAAEKGVQLANIFNRGQEFIVRRGIFQATLAQEMRKQGQDLLAVIRNNQIGTIPEEAVKVAVDKALTMTWAEQPQWGTLGQKFVSFVNAMPGASFAIPFPRFMVNSLKFFYEYNPAGFLSYLSAAERANFAAGHVEKASKAILGSAMLLTAYQVRSSDLAGEKWFEAKVPAGTPGYEQGGVLDLRPFNPFAAYLFVADLAKRTNDGTLNGLTTKDLAMGILSTNLRAGTGLFLLDKTLEGISGYGDPEKFKRALAEFAGEIGGGLLTPLKTISDLVREFDGTPNVQHDRREEPFLGPIKQALPGGDLSMPVSPSPFRSKPAEVLHPAIRQATGASIREAKNPVESEVDRLGIPWQRVAPRMGELVIDRAITERMGRLAETGLVPLVQSPVYQQMTPDMQRFVLQAGIAYVRNEARQQMKAERPDLAAKLQLDAVPQEVRHLIRSLGLPDPATAVP